MTENYGWLNGDGSRRQVAEAMARVATFTDRLIGTAGTSEPPTLTIDDADFEVWALGIQGAGRSASVVWQRTVAATASGWTSLPSPAPVDVQVATSGSLIGAWNLRTGDVIAIADGVVPVADDPIWVEVG